MEKHVGRNGWIDLCRIIAAYGIVALHSGYIPIPSASGGWRNLPGGGIFVEYFFLVSGYFSIAHIEKNRSKISESPEKEIAKYCLKKYLHFLPFAFFVVVIRYILTFVLNPYTIKDMIKTMFIMPFEILLMRNTGIILKVQSGILWYLSALLIMLPIVLYIAVKFEGIFKNYVVWLFPLFVYGLLIRQIGTIRTTDYIPSDLRAAAGLILGGAFIIFLSR